jgi:leucyl aminopeptidase
MIEFSQLLQPDIGQDAHQIDVIPANGFEDWIASQPETTRTLALANRFTAKAGDVLIIPGKAPDAWSAVTGSFESEDIWGLAAVAAKLPAGTYRLANGAPGQAALGWMLAHYLFDRYLPKADPMPVRVLLTSAPAMIGETVQLADATALVRDLVNTPAADMGPADMQSAAETLAAAHGASVTVTKGHDLETGYPMIHAVGMAAHKGHAPRLIEIEWGNPKNPRVAIVGKGISFDTGGLNLKPGGSMRLMKKDMGGAAHAISLAKLIMDARLPVRLHMIVAAAENAIGGNAFRPGDVLQSRQGLTVEIDNTDAEGRLVLGDALAKAVEAEPALIIDFATLTGAARVALGPDLPPFFANNDALAAAITASAQAVSDPVWRMPLWAGYADMLKSDVADVVNSAEGGMAGAVTAALFLQKFVPDTVAWAHFDTFAWRPSPKPGRPKGGDALGLRAAFAALKTLYPNA